MTETTEFTAEINVIRIHEVRGQHTYGRRVCCMVYNAGDPRCVYVCMCSVTNTSSLETTISVCAGRTNSESVQTDVIRPVRCRDD